MNLMPHLIGGRSNWAPISARGKEQAEALGLFLRKNDFIPAKVVSSPAERTMQTAEHSLATMGLDVEVEIDDAIQELDQGDWEGLPREQIYTPELITCINDMNGTFRPPNGESPRDVARRMYAALETRVIEVEDGGSLHVYTHGFAIRSLVGQLSGWSHQQVVGSSTDNTSITRLEYDDGWTVTGFAEMPE